MGRGSILVGVMTLAAILSPASPIAVSAEPQRIDRKPEFAQRVNAAIDAGVAWVKSAQMAGGAYPDYGNFTGGVTALAYCTMRVCGVPREDPAAVRTFEAMRQQYRAATRRSELRTYTAALFCMALAEHGDPVPMADRSGERLYKLETADLEWMKELVRFLEDTQDDAGRWTYPWPSQRPSNAYDNSNTQYALLGLKAASRAGVRARTQTWTKALKHFLEAQDADGPSVRRFEPGQKAKGRTTANPVDRARGWGYLSGGASYGSMTAGGVGSVVICRSELLGGRDYPPALDARADQSARDGIAWLGRNFDVTTNPGPNGTMNGSVWLYYYLYALERAGVLANVEWMGEHDWYGEGAEFLVARQHTTGAWTRSVAPIPIRAGPADVSGADAVVTTCFALLFLKRGTPPVARGALTQSFDDSDINFAVAGSLSVSDFADFVDVVLSRWRRAPDPATRERILARATAVGPRIVAPLVERLQSTKSEEREAAFALLVRATGLDHGYDPLAPADARESAVSDWQAWLLANERALRFDPAAGRLVAK